jgi:hypothetical protein
LTYFDVAASICVELVFIVYEVWGSVCVRGAARNQVSWWAVLFLPILLRSLVPVGFMSMVGPNFSVQLVVCDGDGPMAAPASTPTSMDMPAGMAMDGATDSTGSPDHHPSHVDRGSCPYGSAPALGALPTLSILPPLLIQQSVEASLATAQVAHVEVSPRTQSPRGPPV